MAAVILPQCAVSCASYFPNPPQPDAESAQFQSVESRIERAFLHAQCILERVLDKLRDGIAVQRALHQRFQEQHVERALQQFTGLGLGRDAVAWQESRLPGL
jgi:hypothetical protein